MVCGCLAESTAMFEQSAPRIDAVIIKAGFGNLTEWQVKLEGGLINEIFHPKYISRVLPSVFNYAVALLVGLRCWLGCVDGWFALLVGLRCWLGCVAFWFA